MSEEEGTVCPMIVTRAWADGVVNGQVLLDGSDSLWATSVDRGNGPGQWQWPTRSGLAPLEVGRPPDPEPVREQPSLPGSDGKPEGTAGFAGSGTPGFQPEQPAAAPQSDPVE
jgi:hypothetical protein